MAEPLPDWALAAQPLKMIWLEQTERGDLPPVVFARKAGVELAIVMANQVDKELGIEAAFMLKRALDPDELILAVDAHVYRAGSKADFEAARATWPGGLMQRACDEQAACATGAIMDCLNVLKVNRLGRIAVAQMGYHYHGRSGPAFRWDSTPWAAEPEDAQSVTGSVADALRAIMASPSMFEETPEDPADAAMLAELLEHDPDRARAIAARTAFDVLADRGYQVLVPVPVRASHA